MKRLTYIVGAGGTGSYLIPNILRQYNDSFIENKVIVLDGDFLEQRNLLRQGFFNSVINYSKSEAMYKMHGKNYYGFLECNTTFLNYADEIVTSINEQTIDFDEIVLISCVDNNMARLRLLIAQQMIKTAFPNKVVLFADSGNEEWFGQTILSYMGKDDKPFIDFSKNNFTLIEENIPETVDTVFSYLGEDWIDKLTKGDHEMSCDIVVESAPQNIATNMMASNVLLYTINKFFTENKVENVYFDCKLNISNIKTKNEKETLISFFKSLIDYLNSEEVINVISEQFLDNNKDSDVFYVKKPFTIKKKEVTEKYVVVDYNELKASINKGTINNTRTIEQGITPKNITEPIGLDIDLDIDLPLDTEQTQSKDTSDFLGLLELELSKPKKQSNALNSIIEELKLDI